MRVNDTPSFIKHTNNLFGDWFDFSKTIYDGRANKLEISCPKHGSFTIYPGNFFTYGCKKCAYEVKIKKHLEKANKIHNDKYDYSKIDLLKPTSIKQTIICPTHGEFSQTLKGHIHLKNGCPSCYGNKKFTLDKVINLAVEVHGDTYDYSKVKYKNIDTKVEIVCPEHSSFWQTPYNHINNKQGCPNCTRYIGEIKISEYLEEHHIEYEVQKRFEDCRDKKQLPFDFYIPNRNLLIEYDGIQHFNPVDIFGGKDYLKIVQHHDAIKNKYCEEKEINLQRITYKENIIKRMEEIYA